MVVLPSSVLLYDVLELATGPLVWFTALCVVPFRRNSGIFRSLGVELRLEDLLRRTATLLGPLVEGAIEGACVVVLTDTELEDDQVDESENSFTSIHSSDSDKVDDTVPIVEASLDSRRFSAEVVLSDSSLALESFRCSPLFTSERIPSASLEDQEQHNTFD
uniref:Uncharacterized protein n=1 Tax=Anopheles merus TaxID=30066 RepID=A0A182UNM4_ANOME